ncbi:MAG TPA: hypothetical protein VMP01_15100 [Pirellulaceae bacterium]|nr:hypothetical protein [Pirellulaceae bacterium]
MKRLWFLAALVTSAAVAQEPAEPRADVAKGRVVERPTEILVAELSVPVDLAAETAPEAKPAAADRTKRAVIEPAAEAIVRGTQPPDAAAAEESTAATVADDNPRVEPGKVQWHDGVDAAITAAKSSGKPILVFHLLGELDQRFT